jgi:hypothetical protein
MPISVSITPPASAYRDAMRRRERKNYDAWLNDFTRRGCAAMGYRMYGDGVDRLCVKHLSGNLRVIVVFDSQDEATIIALGPHDEADRRVNVYSQVYAAAEINPPTGERTKPPCCDDDGFPPADAELADRLAENIRALEKTMRRRQK